MYNNWISKIRTSYRRTAKPGAANFEVRRTILEILKDRISSNLMITLNRKFQNQRPTSTFLVLRFTFPVIPKKLTLPPQLTTTSSRIFHEKTTNAQSFAVSHPKLILTVRNFGYWQIWQGYAKNNSSPDGTYEQECEKQVETLKMG